MITLIGKNVINNKKFERVFGPPEEDIYQNKNKPEDFLQLFEGDIDEDFHIGLAITKKALKVDYFYGFIVNKALYSIFT